MRTLLNVLMIFAASLFFGSATATTPDRTLDKTEVREVVDSTIELIASDYLFEKKAPAVISLLEEQRARGEFDRDFLFGRLRQHLEVSLYRASGDSNFELQQRVGFATATESTNREAAGAIESSLHAPDIGVLAFHGDLNFATAQADLARAIKDLADVNAIIIDLRDAGLGSLALTQQLLSYFLAPGEALADVHFPNGRVEHLISQPEPGVNLIGDTVPVYILNSAFVTGPWELFAYTAKRYDRAVVIGQKTMGVAVMTENVPVSDNVRLKFSRALLAAPDSRDNWQDWGVDADHDVPADQSFSQALNLASEALVQQERQSGKRASEYRRAVNALPERMDK